MTGQNPLVAWEKVYIFISSTFNDMHAERDFLVKRVFPRLREWCERRKLRMMDVDLRWGITEQDATRHSGVVDVCLRRIDDCRPFFICFLGQRYGWVPGPKDISGKTLETYPQLEARLGEERSVTELEILHAVVKPFRADREAAAGGYVPAEHAFFYFRDPSYLNEMPAELHYLRRVFTDEAESDPERRRFLLERLKELKELTIPLTGRPVHRYRCCWNFQMRSPELAMPVRCQALLPENIERWRALWKEAAGVKVAGLDVAEDELEASRAREFNEKLTAGRLSDFRLEDGESLEESVLRDLKAAIEARFPDHTEATALGDLARELDQQEHFLFINNEGFIERQGDFEDLDGYIRSDLRHPFILTGSPGSGKTMLLANWIDRLRAWKGHRPDRAVLFRFIGASDGSTTVPSLLMSILRELREFKGRIEGDIPQDPIALRRSWFDLLAEATRSGETILVIDALDQLETGLQDLTWIPMTCPPNLKLILSFKSEEAQARDILQRFKDSGAAVNEVKPFRELDDRRRLVKGYLSQYLKELDEPHIEALIQTEGASSPLFLKVVLSELRLHGAFASLGEKIASDFGNSPLSAFEAVLRRLEIDPAYSLISAEVSVPLLFGLLTHARQGLSVEELSALLIQAMSFDSKSPDIAEAITDSLHLFLRQVRPYLARRGGRYDFYYDSFRKAALRRYTAESGKAQGLSKTTPDWHRLLADYFSRLPLWQGPVGGARTSGADDQRIPNQRKVYELPYHLTWCGDVKGLEETIASLEFIEAKCRAGLAYDLVADFKRIGADTEDGPVFITPLFYRDGLGGHCPYCQGTFPIEKSALGQPSSCPLCAASIQINPFYTNRFWSPCPPRRAALTKKTAALSLTQKLTEFSAFIRSRIHVLSECPHLTFQEAANYLDKTAPKNAALFTQISGRAPRFWLSRVGSDKISGPIMTLSGHSGSVLSLAVTADNKKILSSGIDGTLRVWDAATGAPIMVKEGQSQKKQRIPLVEGRERVAVVRRGRLAFWNYETGQMELELDCPENAAEPFALSPDGRYLASGFASISPPEGKAEQSLYLWDLEKRERLPLATFTKPVSLLAFSPSGRMLFVAAPAHLFIFDPEQGFVVYSIKIKADDAVIGGEITSLAVSPDERLVLAAYMEMGGYIKLWDLKTRNELLHLVGHKGMVFDVIFTPDGKKAVSASVDSTLKVWDVGTGNSITTIHGHNAPIFSAAVTPDGQRVLSGGQDGRICVWDLLSNSAYFKAAREMLTKELALPDDPEKKRRGMEHLLHRMSVLDKHSIGLTHMEIARDKKRLVTSSLDGTLRIWNTSTGDTEHVLGSGEKEVTTFALSPDGKRIVSGDIKLNLSLWDVESGKLLGIREAPGKGALSQAANLLQKKDTSFLGRMDEFSYAERFAFIIFSPDGRSVLSWDSRRRGIRLWDSQTLEEAGEIRELATATSDISFDPTGNFLAAALSNGVIVVLDFRSQKIVMNIEGAGAGIKRMGQKGCLDWTPDGQAVACGRRDLRLCVWEIQTGRERIILQDQKKQFPVITTAVSPDGRMIASASGEKSLSCIEAWSLETGEKALELDFKTGHVTPAWVQNGRYLVTGGSSEFLKVWDLSERGILTMTPSPAALLLARDRLIFSCDDSGGVFIFELSSAGLVPRMVEVRNRS
jgi:WD40 repeat protein